MANSCCFFMPLRYGAAAMATLEFLLSAVLAIALWVEVSKWTGYNVGIRLTGVTAAAATYYTILSFSALVGSLAIFVRNRGVLRYFAFCLGWSLGLQLAVSALQLWGYLSTPRSSIVAECASKRGDQEACLGAFALSIGWLITSIVVGLLVQLCSAYVVSSYSTKLSEEDSLTASAPIPHTKSVSRRASRASIATTIVAHPEGKEKQWDNEKGTGGDDDNDDADGDGLRLDPGPPQVPMLDPAPPRRIPRVRPQYPQGLGPGSADAAILSAASKARSSRLVSGQSSPHATSADASVISTPTAVPAPKPQPSSDPFSDRPRPSFESDSTLVLPTDPAMMV